MATETALFLIASSVAALGAVSIAVEGRRTRPGRRPARAHAVHDLTTGRVRYVERLDKQGPRVLP